MSERSLLRAALPPGLLALALVLAVVTFALLWRGGPEEGMDLHRARVAGDDARVEVLEAEVARRRLGFRAGVGALAAGSALAVVVAFLAMRPASGR